MKKEFITAIESAPLTLGCTESEIKSIFAKHQVAPSREVQAPDKKVVEVTFDAGCVSCIMNEEGRCEEALLFPNDPRPEEYIRLCNDLYIPLSDHSWKYKNYRIHFAISEDIFYFQVTQ